MGRWQIVAEFANFSHLLPNTNDSKRYAYRKVDGRIYITSHRVQSTSTVIGVRRVATTNDDHTRSAPPRSLLNPLGRL
jgi:hypothetical protein